MDGIAEPVATEPVVYPESDGKRMAENTLQYQWIVYFRENIAALFDGRPDVVVAADNLIYPVRGDASISVAPDVYVAVGRPAGHRGSYRIWEEGDLFPQVVVEVVSPSNTRRDLLEKLRFYRRYGAEEYVLYDPAEDVLEIWVRERRRFVPVEEPNGWVSPRLKIRFDTSASPMVVYGPDGERFLSFQELKLLRDQAKKDRAKAEKERDKAIRERDAANARAEKLADELRKLGIDPTNL